MNCKCAKLLVLFFVLLSLVGGCVYDNKSCLQDYEHAVQILEIGPFEFRDVSGGEILNELFKTANVELARNGYDRSIAIVARGVYNDVAGRDLSIQMPRKSIRDAMLWAGGHIGLRVKFVNGTFVFSSCAVSRADYDAELSEGYFDVSK